MEQYLLELIKSNNRVIVPNFGAFIVSRDAGTTVLFNNFLSFNDGLLINHISSKKGIETTEATEQVSGFVDKVKKELDEKGEYTIDKLGTFTKDQNGILRFTQDAGLAELLPEVEEEKSAVSKSEDDKLLDIDNNASEEPRVDEDKKEKEDVKDVPPAASPKDSKLLNLDEKPKASENKPPLNQEKKSADKKPPVVNASGKSTVIHKDDKGGIPPWLIAILILIPVVLILLYLFFWRDSDQEKVVKKPAKEVVDTVVSKPVVDSAAIKKAEEERLRKEQEAKERAEAEKAKVPRHHIIVGSFKDEANAQKLVKKLKESGFESATSFTHNNMVLVSAESYESLLKARDAQEKVLQEKRMENWILTKK